MPIYGGTRTVDVGSVTIEAALSSVVTTLASVAEYDRDIPQVKSHLASVETFNGNLPQIKSHLASVESYDGNLPQIKSHLASMENNTLDTKIRLQASLAKEVSGTGDNTFGSVNLHAIINGMKQTGIASVMDGATEIAIFDFSDSVGYFDFHGLPVDDLEINANATQIGSGVTVLYT